jgi:hypothetical protein
MEEMRNVYIRPKCSRFASGMNTLAVSFDKKLPHYYATRHTDALRFRYGYSSLMPFTNYFVRNKGNRKFWEQLIAYFPLIPDERQRKLRGDTKTDRKQGDLINLLDMK